jgi:hypothetical protein
LCETEVGAQTFASLKLRRRHHGLAIPPFTARKPGKWAFRIVHDRTAAACARFGIAAATCDREMLGAERIDIITGRSGRKPGKPRAAGRGYGDPAFRIAYDQLIRNQRIEEIWLNGDVAQAAPGFLRRVEASQCHGRPAAPVASALPDSSSPRFRVGGHARRAGADVLEPIQQRINARIVTPLFNDTDGVSRRRAVTAESTTNGAERRAETDMGEIHRNLASEGGLRRTARRLRRSQIRRHVK